MTVIVKVYYVIWFKNAFRENHFSSKRLLGLHLLTIGVKVRLFILNCSNN